MRESVKLTVVIILFAALFIYGGAMSYFAVSTVLSSGFPGWYVSSDGRVQTTHFGGDNPASVLQDGDEVVLLDGQPFETVSQYWQTSRRHPPGELYNLTVRRHGALQEFTLQTTQFPPMLMTFMLLARGGMFYVWLIGGLLILLLQRNNKQALVLGLLMGLASIGGEPPANLVLAHLPTWLLVVLTAIFLTSWISVPLLLHFALIFPERSSLLRRVSHLEWLIYVPALVGLPLASLKIYYWMFEPARYFDIPRQFPVLSITNGVLVGIYVLSALSVMVLNYFQGSESQRRRIRVVVVAAFLALLPFAISQATRGSRGLPVTNESAILSAIPIVMLAIFPLSVAYAIARHQVIPVSLIIRRSVQYLLAKNGLRILLALPIIGVIATIAAHPERTIAEVLFRNSMYFYFSLTLAIVLGQVFRKKLMTWIDRKFFREAYNQERILRELIDDVKKLNSMREISRLICQKVDAALHPDRIYLFYREEEKSGLSLGYSSDTTEILRIPEDFQLLRFMELQDSAQDFPFPPRNKLPQREKDWLAQLGTTLIVPMTETNSHLAGLFVLGQKRSEIPYTASDRELLETLADEIALLHENARLRRRVDQEAKAGPQVAPGVLEFNQLKECPQCGACYDNSARLCEQDGSELTSSLPVERVIDKRYRLDKLIGQGGMGAVYEGTDLRLNRRVAIKILRGSMFGDRTAQLRFEHEARTCARLSHPNIITVHDYGVLGMSGAYLVMELVTGETLRALLKRKRLLDPVLAASLLNQGLEALKAAHSAGVVHRDLKPENMLIVRSNGQDQLKILDFGLAKLTHSVVADSQSPTMPAALTSPGMAVGTVGYMAPEQLMGGAASEQTDLFSFGVVVVEVLTGQLPFTGITYHDVMTKILQHTYHLPVHSEAGQHLDDVLQRCLAKDPMARFSSAAELQSQLIPALHDCPSTELAPDSTGNSATRLFEK